MASRRLLYTQLSEVVENEVNGFLTYDRSELIKKLTRRQSSKPPTDYIRCRITPSRFQTPKDQAEQWRYTLQQPPPEWISPAYNDSGWLLGNAAFGTPGTPNLHGWYSVEYVRHLDSLAPLNYNRRGSERSGSKRQSR